MPRQMYKAMDPLEIESRFSNERAMYYRQGDEAVCFSDLEPFLEKLPRREVELIEMYLHENKKQKEIAAFFNVTQGAISHRLSRAYSRLRFLRDMPKIGRDIKEVLNPYFEDFEVDVIVYMVETTCQSRTAELLNSRYSLQGKKKMTQVKVRHKFDRYIDRVHRLKRSHEELIVCCNLLEYIRSNLYMMHEVILPHFDKGFQVAYSDIR